MINRILTLIYKELWAVWGDKKSRFILVLPPLLQLFIFSFAATLDVQNVSIGVVNRDGGERSIELLARFQGSSVFNRIYYLDSIQEITPFIDNQKGVMVVSIDEQFSRNLDASTPATIQLILDGRKSNTAQILMGYATQIVNQFSQDYTSIVSVAPPTTTLVSRYWFNPNLIYYWYNVPSMVAILTMVVALLVTGLSVAREREMGTFDQLLVSPMSPFEILLGKTIPAIIIGMAGATLILIAGVFVFRVPFTGSLFLLYLSLIVFVSSVVGVGLFVSSLSSTQQQAILGTYLFMSPAVLLSGFATPIENMPHWLQIVSYANPLRYILVIVRGIFLKGISTEIVLSNIWPMAIIAILSLSLSSFFFRHRLE